MNCLGDFGVAVYLSLIAKEPEIFAPSKALLSFFPTQNNLI
jgi:hypothetical protein